MDGVEFLSKHHEHLLEWSWDDRERSIDEPVCAEAQVLDSSLPAENQVPVDAGPTVSEEEALN